MDTLSAMVNTCMGVAVATWKMINKKDSIRGHRDLAEKREKDYPKQNSRERRVTLKSKLVEDFSSNRENRDGIHVVLPGKLSRENRGWVGRTYWKQKEESTAGGVRRGNVLGLGSGWERRTYWKQMKRPGFFSPSLIDGPSRVSKKMDDPDSKWTVKTTLKLHH
ncbi:hypothetical protein ACFX2I_031306 [Malus domestica]